MKRLILLLFGLVACGPIQTTQGIIGAQNSLKETRLQHAYTYAPYEYTKARLYLKMAKEREGRSDFQAATRFARTAKRYSDAAQHVIKNPKLLELRRKYEPEFKQFDVKPVTKNATSKPGEVQQ